MNNETHGREVVQNITLRLVCENEECGDRESARAYEGNYGGYVRHLREPIEGRRSQASIDEERVVVTDEGETDDAYRLKNAWFNYGKPL